MKAVAEAVGKAVRFPAIANYFWGESSSTNEPSGKAESVDACQESIRIRCSCDDSYCTSPDGSHPAKAVAVGAVAGGATGVAAVAAAVPIIQAVGFTANGIAAGSMAAGMMSSAAAASGGAIASGSTVAVCQSIGALGVLPGVIAGPVVLGAVAVGMAAPAVIGAFRSGRSEQQSADERSAKGENCWVIASEEDEGEVCVSRYDDEEAAREAFDKTACPRILFSPDHHEEQVGGLAARHGTIRRLMEKHYFCLATERARESGDRAFAAGNFKDATLCYTDAVTLHTCEPMTPSRLHVYYSNRSAALLELGDAPSALADAEQALELKPDWCDGFLCKGESLTRLGRFAEALGAYTDGIAIDGSNEAFLDRLRALKSKIADEAR